jgi:hypothetical protein
MSLFARLKSFFFYPAAEPIELTDAEMGRPKATEPERFVPFEGWPQAKTAKDIHRLQKARGNVFSEDHSFVDDDPKPPVPRMPTWSPAPPRTAQMRSAAPMKAPRPACQADLDFQSRQRQRAVNSQRALSSVSDDSGFVTGMAAGILLDSLSSASSPAPAPVFLQETGGGNYGGGGAEADYSAAPSSSPAPAPAPEPDSASYSSDSSSSFSSDSSSSSSGSD